MSKLAVFFFMFCFKGLYAAALYDFQSLQQEEEFNELTSIFRCLVCQNQNLADSNAPLAKDLRLQIYEQVKKGESKEQIIDYLTSRYGDFVVYQPPLKKATLILWGGPFLFLLLGLMFFRSVFRRGENASGF